jgi:hypothetical protein
MTKFCTNCKHITKRFGDVYCCGRPKYISLIDGSHIKGSEMCSYERSKTSFADKVVYTVFRVKPFRCGAEGYYFEEKNENV